MNWDAPLAEASEVATVEDAARYLPFPIASPEGLGSPDQVLITDPAVVPLDFRVIGMKYQAASFERIWILVETSSTTQSELEGLAEQCNPDKGCQGVWRVVALEDGTTALVIDAPTSVAVIWLVDGLKVHVLGPPPDVLESEAIAFANQVVSDSAYSMPGS
jgi:hypothetical protein